MLFKNFGLLLLPLTYVLLLYSCSKETINSQITSSSDGTNIIKNVPFVRQKDKFCGPAAMASVMNFYGQNISQDQIAEEVYSPELKGALISDMGNFAREMGYNASIINGDENTLISLVDEGIPSIILVDLGIWVLSVPHYYVVYGYNKSKETFIINTGFTSNKEMNFKDLDKEWEKMNRLMLIVRR
jgi:ABC-type bacteriocin/lantibiotic exporter with double-glycine peptidase domain